MQLFRHVVNSKGRSQGQQDPCLKIKFEDSIHAITKVIAQKDKFNRQGQRETDEDQDEDKLLRQGNTTTECVASPWDRRPVRHSLWSQGEPPTARCFQRLLYCTRQCDG